MLISRKDIYFVADWVNLLLFAMMSHDWEISKTIISDRDSKFRSSFWRTIFQKLDIKHLISIVYYSQIDEQFERTNQIVEIELRYYLISNFDENFTEILSYLQSTLNNSASASTDLALNEIVYEFKTHNIIELLADLSSKDFSRLREIKRDQAKKAISKTNLIAKHRYDLCHMSIQLRFNAYLRLHHDYTILELENKKLFNQRTDSFKVLSKIEKLIYELKLSLIMIIYSVIFIAQLESVLERDNSYSRNRISNLSSMQTQNDENNSFYKIEILLNKSIRRDNIHYLVKWKDYDNSHNAWYALTDLQNSLKLIKNYKHRSHKRKRDSRSTTK